jgi:2-dehydropantoate 2-reductase
MASILLIGPGAIGATLAAWLCQDDRHRVTVAARTPFESIETQTPGGVIRATPQRSCAT